MCSFDIHIDIFTCVLLTAIIDICADIYYTDINFPLLLFQRIFSELMKFSTMSVEFSFDVMLYRQIDGILMGSPLGPILANIFVGVQ